MGDFANLKNKLSSLTWKAAAKKNKSGRKLFICDVRLDVSDFMSQPQVVAHGASRWLDFVSGGMLYRLPHKNSGLCVECVPVSLCLVHQSNKSAQSVSVCLLSIFFFISV